MNNLMRVFIVLSMFWWAGCTQQEEPKTDLVQRVKTGILIGGGIVEVHYSEPPFDPNKHYIVRIDTVGVHWGRGLKKMDTTFYKDYYKYPYGSGILMFDPEDSLEVLFIDPIHGMMAIYELDTIFAPLVSPLFTPEELKKIKDWLGG